MTSTLGEQSHIGNDQINKARKPLIILPYDKKTLSLLYDLYYDVACQRTGIARLPFEITTEYITSIYEGVTKSGIGFSAFNVDGQLVGDLHAEIPSIQIFKNVLWNLTIAVHPEFQGRGIGKLLFKALINAAVLRGDINRIELFCKERNINGIKLYKSMGFLVEGTLRNRTNLDGNPENDLVMGLLFR